MSAGLSSFQEGLSTALSGRVATMEAVRDLSGFVDEEPVWSARLNQLSGGVKGEGLTLRIFFGISQLELQIASAQDMQGKPHPSYLLPPVFLTTHRSICLSCVSQVGEMSSPTRIRIRIRIRIEQGGPEIQAGTRTRTTEYRMGNSASGRKRNSAQKAPSWSAGCL